MTTVDGGVDLEGRSEQAREQERAEHVGGERELETVDRQLALGRQHARVVHEHVQLLLVVAEAAGEVAHRAQARHVAVPYALGAALGPGALAALRAARQQVHARAEPGERRGGGQPDAARGPAHQHHAPVHARQLLPPAAAQRVAEAAVTRHDGQVERAVQSMHQRSLNRPTPSLRVGCPYGSPAAAGRAWRRPRGFADAPHRLTPASSPGTPSRAPEVCGSSRR